MKIVIDIPEGLFETYKGRPPMLGDAGMDMIAQAIANGTPIPKGHGRLKDIDEVERILDLDKPDNIIAKALKTIIESIPTIVEAESEE